MAFSWTNFPVGDETVKIVELNEVYTKINSARTASGISGSVSSEKSSTDDLITAEDINKVRAEIDIVDDLYTTGCSTHNMAVNSAVDLMANSSHNTTQCSTMHTSHNGSYQSTHYTTYRSSYHTSVY